MNNDIQQLISQQHQFFYTNQTKEISFRIAQLKKLKQLLEEYQKAMYDAIQTDFGKSEFETFLSELVLVYDEINYFIKHIHKLSRRKKVSSGIFNFPARSYIIPEPLGTTLVIGAWNYPYQLSLIPALTSLAAGNTVILKPSELPTHTSAVIAHIINDNFPEEYFHVVEGGIETTTQLLSEPFDKIFFTGSTTVGRIVYTAAAKHLTPVTLELGGKSPVFVLKDANIKKTAQRLIWGKFLNAGQTCVAPDYIWVDQAIESQLTEALKEALQHYPSHYMSTCQNYVQIINLKNFDRLASLIEPEKVCYGGVLDRENRFISPTLMRGVLPTDKVMQEEIFGPILPILSFKTLNEAIEMVKKGDKPLACYIYSKDKPLINKILTEISFGGGAINDSLMHLTNKHLPFGGVGNSGIGSYHGKAGFDTFSHYKSILHKGIGFKIPFRYMPYSLEKLKWLKRLLGVK